MAKLFEINRFERESMLKYVNGFSETLGAIRSGNYDRFEKYSSIVDMSISENLIVRYAAAHKSDDIFELAYDKTKDVNKAELLCCMLSGNRPDRAKKLGNINSEILSAEAMAICAQNKDLLGFMISYYDDVNVEELTRHDLVSIACKSGLDATVSFLLSKGYDFCLHNALVSAASNDNVGCLELILDSNKYATNCQFQYVFEASLSASINGYGKSLSLIANRYNEENDFSDVICNQNFAIMRASGQAESLDCLDVCISNGADLSYDDYVIVEILTNSDGQGKFPNGNTELFKYIADKCNWDFDFNKIKERSVMFHKKDIKKLLKANKHKSKIKFIG